MISNPTHPNLLRPRRVALVLGLALLAWLTAPAVQAQTVASPFDGDYSLVDLGSVPGLPSSYGGLTFKAGDPNVLLIGGLANSPSGALYEVSVVRDAQGHVTGFASDAVMQAPAPYPDGGLAYGPGGVLFMARWPVNEIGQLMPGSASVDKVVELGALGVTDSPGGLNFVPEGFPGAGSMKLVTWIGGEFYDLALSPDGAGTYDVAAATIRTVLPGGPEGFVYVPAGSPQFDDFTTMLVSEYDTGSIVAYDVDAGGNPVPASRTLFVDGLAWALGAAIDPLTGDFLFSTFGGGERVVAVRGFAAPDSCTPHQEVCDNGIDDDCDELVDGDDDECAEVCVDEDGDGYGTAGSVGCSAGDLPDCDDSNAAVHPGAAELPGSFADENCDGLTVCDPCAEWWNHGQYVSCVSHAVKDLVRSGHLSRQEGSRLTSAAGRSSIGHAGYTPPQCSAGDDAGDESAAPGNGRRGHRAAPGRDKQQRGAGDFGQSGS